MKKIISVILTAFIFAAALPAAANADNGDCDLKIAVASDLHYRPAGGELEKTNDDEILWYANRRAALEQESGFIIDEFLRQCALDDEIGFVLISGDLADNGKSRPQDQREVAEKLENFERQTGKQVFVINGNHDNGVDCEGTTEVFKEIYKNLGYDLALSTDEGTCSYTADLGEKYRLIALDSCDPTQSTEDGMSIKKLLWVKNEAKKALSEGRYLILMQHHNLLDHMPVQRVLNHDFIVRFHLSTAAIYADLGIKAVFTGHEHCSDATSYTSPQGNTICDFATTSLTMYPLTYRVVSFSDDEIRYESKTVDKIDTAALIKAQPALSDVQTDAMDRGMNDYARAFLKKGVEYRLALSLTPAKIGVSEKDFYYDIVMKAVDGLTGLLSMPLYGENSVSALALEYGIEIPESGYKNLWDLATTLVSAHYAGEEAYELTSDEVTILLRGASLILKDDLSNYNDEIILSWVTDILRNNGMNGITNSLTKLCSSWAGGIRPDEYMAAALISPLLYKFAFDDDGINDNNGTISGYGSVDRINAAKNDFISKLNTLFTFIKLYFGFIIRIFK